jgi:hypothetical protein
VGLRPKRSDRPPIAWYSSWTASIFGFFRVYPVYLIKRFHMTVARESLFVAWVAVPIVVANLGLVGWLARRMTARQTAT